MGVAISNNNKYVISIGSDYNIKIFDFERRAFVHNFKAFHEGKIATILILNLFLAHIQTVNLMINDQYILTTDIRGKLNIFNMESRAHLYSKVVTKPGEELNSMFITDDEKKIIIGTSEKRALVLTNPLLPDTATGKHYLFMVN